MGEIKYITDNFRGYKLKAIEEFWNMTPVEISKSSNGCGPSGWKFDIIPDEILGVDLSPACIIHDIEYLYGETKEDKDEADLNLLHNMNVINNACSRIFLMKWLRRRIIFDYYSAVADLGAVAFEKGKEDE